MTGSTTSPPSGILLRRARASDLPGILAIERVSFTDPWSRSSFTAILEQPRVYFAAALDAAGSVLGYTVAWFVLDEAELANLAVAPEARGKGIGALLLRGALAAAEERGVAAMYLEVRASNVPARALYSAHGFVEVGRRAAYYRRPVEDALILRRSAQGATGVDPEPQRK